MVESSNTETKQWAPMGKACQILEVNEATLRRWADRGLVRSYRTPGGHRRFALEDLWSLAGSSLALGTGDLGHNMTDTALRHIRRRLRSRSVVQQSWYEHIHEDDRGRMRLFGHRLLTLAGDFLGGHGRRLAMLAEARLVGEEYGAEIARMGLPLEDATQAFAFFRNSLMEGLQEVGIQDASPSSVYRSWQQVNAITDEVLQAIVRSYRKAEAKQGADQSPDPSEAMKQELDRSMATPLSS